MRLPAKKPAVTFRDHHIRYCILTTAPTPLCCAYQQRSKHKMTNRQTTKLLNALKAGKITLAQYAAQLRKADAEVDAYLHRIDWDGVGTN
jgi:hypothetical protein